MTEPAVARHGRRSLRERLAGPPVPMAARGSTLLRHLIVAIAVVAVVMLVTGQIETFYDYQVAIIAAYLCAVAGLTVLTGVNGQVSLGHSALMAVGAYTVAKMQTAFSDHNVTTQWTLLYSLLGAIVVAAVAGLIIGLAAARLRGPYLAGLTLAIVVLVPSVATQYYSFFDGDQGMSVPLNPPPDFLGDGFPPEQWEAYFAVIAAAVTLFLLANLVRSRYGRAMRAVRDDEISAQLAGIHVARTQVVTFVVSAACAGLGGGIYAAVNQAVSPDSYSLTLSLYLLLAIVLGGLGSLAGAIWGSVAIVALPYLTNKAMESVTLSPIEASKLRNNVPLAIFGIALIVIAITAPGGIQGLLRRIGRMFLRPTHESPAVVAAPDASPALLTQPTAVTTPHDPREAPPSPASTPEATT
jgi:branched-chain amino acid transport system permease protein